MNFEVDLDHGFRKEEQGKLEGVYRREREEGRQSARMSSPFFDRVNGRAAPEMGSFKDVWFLWRSKGERVHEGARGDDREEEEGTQPQLNKFSRCSLEVEPFIWLYCIRLVSFRKRCADDEEERKGNLALKQKKRLLGCDASLFRDPSSEVEACLVRVSAAIML